MSNQGFGFTPGGDDDDDDRREGGTPFGFFGFPMGGFGAAGGRGGQPDLGEILNQFGQMLSGMGRQMGDSEGGVNLAVAERMARRALGEPAPVRDSERTALTDALRLVELWLDDATALPAGANRAEGWTPVQWLEHTLPTWRRLVEPVARRMSDASLEGMPAEARRMMGPMLGMMNQMNSMNFGAQLGQALAELARSALTGSDLGLPLSATGAAVLLPRTLGEAAEALELPAREMIVYAAAREAAHQRLYEKVPWLAERMISSVEEYAAGLTLDYSHIEAASREFDVEALQDPARLQEALGKLQGMDLTPRVGSANEHARTRLETLLALVEGWVDVVVGEALGERLPGAAQLDEAWRRRRATAGAEQALKKATGIDLGAPKTGEAAELWRRLGAAVGVARRDAVWDHPDFLPVAEDLDSPAGFIDSVLGGGADDDFDPIAELEEQLRRERAEGDGRDRGGRDGHPGEDSGEDSAEDAGD